uniref:Uncharacterized protein n=1 Tax=uncultured marine bacterium 313 TaxID=257386 RepID=Q6SHQ2_9BACT|nr:hypothetical protein MBMO_EBAC750-11E01.12 [uncultured marine bacterium 313]
MNKPTEEVFRTCQRERKIIHFKEYGKNIRLWLGSAVIAIIFLGSHSKKVNVFGWDHYLNNEVGKLNYIQALYHMAFREPSGPWEKRFKFVFAEAVWNWYYASRLINENKYNIFSNLSDVTKQKSILKKIDKIFH